MAHNLTQARPTGNIVTSKSRPDACAVAGCTHSTGVMLQDLDTTKPDRNVHVWLCGPHYVEKRMGRTRGVLTQVAA